MDYEQSLQDAIAALKAAYEHLAVADTALDYLRGEPQLASSPLPGGGADTAITDGMATITNLLHALAAIQPGNCQGQ